MSKKKNCKALPYRGASSIKIGYLLFKVQSAKVDLSKQIWKRVLPLMS